jgi:hypothetical protein
VTATTLIRRLGADQVVPLTAVQWDAVSSAFEVVGRHDTHLRGDLLVVSTPVGLAAVEAPSAATRVVRRLGNAAAADRFVGDRLDTYERMWNGCGCRIDYYR